MTDIYESLEKLGLTRNEVTIYKYLLRKGVSTGAQIWAENSLDKSSAYRAIGQLQEKRLIYAIGETRNQKFAAYPVEALVELHTKVEKNLSNVRHDIDKFVEDINEYAKENYKSNRIQLFEGAEGAKLFYKQRLQGHVDLIRQFGSWDEVKNDIPDLQDFVEKFIEERVKRAIPIKVLYDASAKQTYFGKTNNEKLKEVRMLPSKLNLPVMCVTHGDSISISTREDGAFMGIIIKDKFIASFFEKMFDVIWDQSKTV